MRGGIDEETLEVRAVEGSLANATGPKEPVDGSNIVPSRAICFAMHCRAVDGAYDTRKCHEAIAARGAAAVIPPRKNAKPWTQTSPGAVARNEALRASKYLGRAIWRRWSGYHRRSRVESKMNSINLLDQSLMARDFDRQVAELQARIAVLHGYTALGRPVTVAVG
jgi:Transposase DDE domain